LRELSEETGAHCKNLTYLGKYYGSPAILDECIDMFLAEDLTMGELNLDDDEFLDLVKIPLSTLVEMVLAGEIPDGKTQVAVLRVNEILRRRGETPHE
jgi:ADP-ribose pyrophosphatase